MADKEFQDENGLVDKAQAVCPVCHNQVQEVDADDEIYHCTKTCGWAGKFVELDFKPKQESEVESG